MKKLVRKLVVDDGTYFDDICSFKTENYIGIWDYKSEDFVMICSSDIEFSVYHLPKCDSIEELDNAVYDYVGEHIIGVSENASYEFKLTDDAEE